MRIKNKSKKRGQIYERKEGYLPHEVLDFLPKPEDYPRHFKLKKITKMYDGDEMKMGSERYYTFAKSLKCAYCDLVGSIMYKERSCDKKGNFTGAFHFNLYAIDSNGNEVLMTKDHIVAKSKGGLNSVKNYTTCCKTCNELKRSMTVDEFELFKQEQKETY